MNELHVDSKHHVFTVGHSNHPLDVFLNLLRQHGIQVLVDVRSQPHSRYAPHFDDSPLRTALIQEGIRYLFLGRELGGRPEDPQFYDAEGFVLYSRIAESSLFLEGVSRLELGIQQYRVAIMCSEESPAGCHRRLLIGRVLSGRGIMVSHIRGDGRVQTESELAVEELGHQPESVQLSFLETERREEKLWRSTRSVSRKETRPPSLES